MFKDVFETIFYIVVGIAFFCGSFCWCKSNNYNCCLYSYTSILKSTKDWRTNIQSLKYISKMMIQRNKGEKLMSGFEDFAFKYIRFILISIIVMLVIVSGEKIGLAIDKRQSSEAQTYAIVEDKYTDTHMAGGVLVTNYYIEVKIGDQKKLEKIQVTYEQYQVISKGSKALCTIYYKRDKIVDVELATTHRKE